MRLPSFSIAEMMAIIALVALECLAIRASQRSLTTIYLLVGGLPMQSPLVSGLFLMFRRRRRMEKSLPFLVGFAIVGWISLLIFGDICFRAPVAIDQHVSDTLSTSLTALGLQPFSTQDIIWKVMVVSTYLTAPQLVVALIAGWISHWWWKRAHPETMPSHP